MNRLTSLKNLGSLASSLVDITMLVKSNASNVHGSMYYTLNDLKEASNDGQQEGLNCNASLRFQNSNLEHFLRAKKAPNKLDLEDASPRFINVTTNVKKFVNPIRTPNQPDSHTRSIKNKLTCREKFSVVSHKLQPLTRKNLKRAIKLSNNGKDFVNPIRAPNQPDLHTRNVKNNLTCREKFSLVSDKLQTLTRKKVKRASQWSNNVAKKVAKKVTKNDTTKVTKKVAKKDKTLFSRIMDPNQSDLDPTGRVNKNLTWKKFSVVSDKLQARMSNKFKHTFQWLKNDRSKDTGDASNSYRSYEEKRRRNYEPTLNEKIHRLSGNAHEEIDEGLRRGCLETKICWQKVTDFLTHKFHPIDAPKWIEDYFSPCLETRKHIQRFLVCASPDKNSAIFAAIQHVKQNEIKNAIIYENPGSSNECRQKMKEYCCQLMSKHPKYKMYFVELTEAELDILNNVSKAELRKHVGGSNSNRVKTSSSS